MGCDGERRRGTEMKEIILENFGCSEINFGFRFLRIDEVISLGVTSMDTTTLPSTAIGFSTPSSATSTSICVPFSSYNTNFCVSLDESLAAESSSSL